MALRTAEQYYQSLKAMHPVVYILGEKVENPSEHPLVRLGNVIITAHSAYYSEQSAAKYKQRIYESVASIVNGQWLDWLINPEVKGNFQKKWKQP